MSYNASLHVRLEGSKFVSGGRQVGSTLDDVRRRAREATGAIDGFQSGLNKLRSAAAVLGVGLMVREIIQARIEFERSQNALRAITGSTHAAGVEYAFIREQANRLGFGISGLAQEYAKLAASTSGTVLQGQATRDVFVAVSEAARVLGLGTDQTNRALVAVGQIAAKGVLSMEELRQQLGEQLPGALRVTAEQLGYGGDKMTEFFKKISQGQISAAEGIPALTRGLKELYGPGVAGAINSVQAELGRIETLLFELKVAASEGLMEGLVAGFADLKGVLSDGQIKQAALELGELLGTGLRKAGEGAAFLAKNLNDVLFVAKALIAIQLVRWFQATAAGIAFAEIASANLATAWWALRSGYLKLIFLDNTKWFAGMASAAALAGGAIIILLLYINDLIVRWGEAEDAAAQYHLKAGRAEGEVLRSTQALKNALASSPGGRVSESLFSKALEDAANAQDIIVETYQKIERVKREHAARIESGTVAPWVEAPGLKDLESSLESMIPKYAALRTKMAEVTVVTKEVAAATVYLTDAQEKALAKALEAIEALRIQAEQAERLAAAAGESSGAYQRETLAIAQENAVRQINQGLIAQGLGLSAQQIAAIELYIARTDAATKVEAAALAQAERDIKFSADARTAEAALADAKSGTSEASRAMAALLEAEAIATSDLRSEDAAYIKGLAASILVRNDYLRSIELEIAAGERALQWKRDQAGLQAGLQDAITGTNNATRQHAIELELETRLLAEGVREWEPRGRQLREEIESRAAIRDRLLAQTAAQERLRAAQSDERRAQAEFTDWQTQEAAALRYGSAIAGILSQFGQLNSATRELMIQEEILAAIRAEGVQIDFTRGLQWNLNARDRQLAIEAEIRGHYDTLDALQKVQAQHALLAYALEPLREAWGQVRNQIKDALIDMALTGKASFRDLASNLLRVMLDAIVEMVIRWVAGHRVMQAEAARTAAVNAAATSGGAGGGSGGGMLGGAWGWFMNTGWGKSLMGNPMTGGNSFMGGSGSGAMGAGIFAIVAAVAINWLEKKGTSWAKTHIVFGGQQGIGISSGTYGAQGANMANNQKNVAQVLQAATGIIKDVQDFLRSFGGEIDRAQILAGEMSITKKGQGKKTRWIVTTVEGLIRDFGKDMDAALEYATIQAIKATPSYGLPPEIAAAIKGSVAEKLDQFNADMATAMAAVRARLGEVGSQAYDTYRRRTEEIAAAQALGIATDDLIKARDRDIDSIRNGLLGINESASKFLASLVSFQAGMDEISRSQTERIRRDIARTQEQIAQLFAAGPRTFEGQDGTQRQQTQEAWERNVARLREQVTRYLAELERIPKALSDQEINMAVFDALYKYLEGNSKYAKEAHKYALLKVELEFAAIKMQLLALNKWEEFEAMFNDAFAAAKEAAGKRGGGRGRGQERDDFRESIRDSYESTLPEATRAWLDLQHTIEDNRKRAKELKVPLAELVKLEEALTAAYQKGLRTRAEELAGVGTDFGRGLQEGLDYFRELRELGRKKTGVPNWLVDLLEGKFLDRMGRDLNTRINQFAGLSDPLADIGLQAQTLREDLLAFAQAAGWSGDQIAEALARIDAGAAYQTGLAKLDVLDRLFSHLKDAPGYEGQIKQLALQRLDIEFAILRAQMVALGIWEANAKAFDDAYKIARDLILTGGDGGSGDIAAAREARREARRQEMERQAEERQRIRDDIRDTFQDILDGLLNFQKSLLLDQQLSPLSPVQQAEEARRQYRDIQARAAGGDIEALRGREAAARAYLEAYQRAYASSGAYQEVFAEVQRDNALLIADIERLRENATTAAIREAGLNILAFQRQAHTDAMTIAAAVAAPANVPGYADGAVVYRPQFAHIAEKGPEAVIPLQSGNVPVAFTGNASVAQSNAPVVAAVDRSGLATAEAIEALRSEVAGLASDLRSNQDEVRKLMGALSRFISLAEKMLKEAA